MQKFIFSVFLFLLLITTATADTGTYTLSYDVVGTTQQYSKVNNGEFSLNPGYWRVSDVEAMSTLDFLECDVQESQWGGSADKSSYDWITLYSDSGLSNPIGSGVYGYIKSPSTGSVRIQLHIGTDLDWGALTGQQTIYMDTSNTLESMLVTYWKSPSVPSQCVLLMNVNSMSVGTSGAGIYANHTARFRYTFINDYEYGYDSAMGCLNYTLYRNSTYPSKLYINNTNTTIKNETSTQTTNFSTYSFDLDYLVWDTVVTTENGNEIQIEVNYTSFLDSGPETTGIIDLSVTTYVKPDIVMADISLENADFTNNNYYAVLQNSSGGWHSFGAWKPIDSYADMLVVWDSIYTGETLPMTIRGALYEYDLNTETYEMIAYSDSATYVETPAGLYGSLWTDKDSYNTTEIVTVYTTTEDGGKVKIDKQDDPLYDWYNVYSGQSNIKVALQTSHVGTWDVYLYEDVYGAGDYILTNQTTFTVLADEDIAYFSWWNSPIYKGEPAPYDYIATSTNSIIKIYDGENIELYRFNASTGYNTGQISTISGIVGNWTGSLYDNGTYYNASMEVESSYSWVRFDADDYYIGDTIGIEYFIVSGNHQIRLRDNRRKIILEWQPGTFMTGQRGFLYYTLCNDNEFGHNVENGLQNGIYQPGEWEVIIDSILYEPVGSGEYEADHANVHSDSISDKIGGTGSEGGLVKECTALAESAGFRGEVGLFILSILIIIITSVAMLVSKFPVPGVLCIDILQFFAFIGIGFIPILYLILFGVVAGLIVFGTIFFKKAG